MSVPGVTIQPMPGDLEPLPARVLPAPPGAGPAAVAAEVLGRVRAELPVVGGLGEREQILVSAWLTGCGQRGPAAPTPETWRPGSAGSTAGTPMC
jgi:hypothetical protein